MNLEDYTQYSLSKEELKGKIEYLTDGLEGIVALLIDDTVLGIELPSPVVLAIIETGRTKTARLTTGVEVQIPEYLEMNELIKVNTETGKSMSRA
jgi:elongation factor P